jgi:3-dehydroquinate dehydratase/shikimate dehydrogenase
MTRALVCETVQGETAAALRAAAEATAADLVEYRLDGLADPDPRAVLAGRRRPAIVTCRPAWEGGRFTGSEEARERLLVAAAEAGAEFVDVEWRAPWRARFARRWADRMVLSLHDFAGVPADLADLVGAMAAAGAAVVKVAVLATRLADLLPLLALRRTLPPGQRLVAIGMGPAGWPSRILAVRFGSCWTYGGEGAAPGQLAPRRLLGEFRVRSLTEATAVYGLVGRPIGHSLSPAMHNAAFAAARLDAVYVPFEAADFADFLAVADALGVQGVSVTAPFKQEAFAAASRWAGGPFAGAGNRAASGMAEAAAGAPAPLADAPLPDGVESEPARRRPAPAALPAGGLAAANTLRREADGRWAALNTDIDGFLAPLAAVPLEGRRASILGAGGAAAAVAAALARRGAQVTIHARRPDASSRLAAAAGVRAGEWPPAPGSWDVLVNATPAGTWPEVDVLPVPAGALGGDLASTLVYDLVYNPRETALLRAARARGAATVGGLEMLVAQAAGQWTWWTGLPAPTAVMRRAAEAWLAGFEAAPVPAPSTGP